MAGSSLTPRQERFVAEYLIDLNATQAAIRAGYSAKTAEVQGPRLLGNVRVAAAIADGQAKRAERNGLIVERHESIVRSRGPEERATRLAELRAERERLTRVH